MRKIAKVTTSDPVLNQLQQNVITAVNPLLTNPILNGVTLSGVNLSSGDNTIQHRLGRTLQGYLIANQYSPGATIYRKLSSNPGAESVLVLNSSSALTIDLYVY